MLVSKLRQFFASDAAGGIVLILSSLLALFLANFSLTGETYEHFLHFPVSAQVGAFGFNLSFVHFVNDAVMAIFFLGVALEIKHEMLHGHLSSLKKASFPFFGAVGGIVIPALLYYSVNYSEQYISEGWAIPMATDIAFAIGVLSLLGNRVPQSIKVFLLALAVIDDLGAILVIALFYTSELYVSWLLFAGVVVLVMLLLNRLNVTHKGPYLVLTLILWYTFLQSGIHATIAGVVAGFIIPNKKINGVNLAHDIEHGLKPWITWFIMPLFAFSNSGINLTGIGDAVSHSVSLASGIFLGLVVGKPVGIFLFTYIAALLKFTAKPSDVNWITILSVGFICGIGFTMSIFITNLSFHEEIPNYTLFDSVAKLSILTSSLLAAIIGVVILYLTSNKKVRV